MKEKTRKSGSELFIVDNSDKDWKALNYLHDWCELSERMDIASGFFEIGSLLALDGEWQKVDQIRILMGDEVSRRTRDAFIKGLSNVKKRLDDSIEYEKLDNDFLEGVLAIVKGIKSGKINCRVYIKDKFHAKAYITHSRLEVVGSAALVGSSNFTLSGLSKNVELNVQITGRPVTVLQDWFEEHWKNAEDITPEILNTIERHTREYSPFEVYAKSLLEFFRDHEMTASEWERKESKIYPILAHYQKEGYHALLKRARHYGGAFLCDGVGLGKTFIGLMTIERMIVHERKNVVLFVPKSTREPVWEVELRKRLPNLFSGFSHLMIFNHTDLLNENKYEKLRSTLEDTDVIIIDEAHNFRNTGLRDKSRYWQLHELAKGKTVFMLTATPVNNRLVDLKHMIDLFAQSDDDYFKDAPLGIHSLSGHFRKMEKSLDKIINANGNDIGTGITETNLAEAEQVLNNDDLFRELVVQRSRAYVKKSLAQEDEEEVLFPIPTEPKVVNYSVKQTYGKLLNMVEEAFSKEKPLFSLPIYYPYAYYKGDDETIDPMVEGRQKQVVALIRTGFLKRFESSAEAFQMSCWNLLKKLLTWLEVQVETDHEKKIYERWKLQNFSLLEYMQEQQWDLWGIEDEEDIVTPEMLESMDKLDRTEFKVDEIIDETLLDLDQLIAFLRELKNFKPSQDKKLTALRNLLKSDSVLTKHKLLIFTEFKDTARYLKKQLEEAGVQGIAEIDGGTKGKRGIIIKRFAPYYNDSSSGQLEEQGLEEIGC